MKKFIKMCETSDLGTIPFVTRAKQVFLINQKNFTINMRQRGRKLNNILAQQHFRFVSRSKQDVSTCCSLVMSLLRSNCKDDIQRGSTDLQPR